MPELPETKRCPDCGETKPVADFGTQIRENGNLRIRGLCRQCMSTRAYRRNTSMHGRWNFSKYSARRRKIPFTLTFKQYEALRSQPCTYCGTALSPTGYGLDRIDHNGGYMLGNVVPCCEHCNRIKADVFTFEEMKLLGVVVAQIIAARGGHRPKSAYGKGRNRIYPVPPTA